MAVKKILSGMLQRQSGEYSKRVLWYLTRVNIEKRVRHSSKE